MKEIGKLVPYLGYKGCLGRCMPYQVAVTRGTRLFNKNIANCKGESLSTVSESWPVLVIETWVQPG